MNPGKYVYKCTVLTQDEKYKRDSTLQLIIQSMYSISMFSVILEYVLPSIVC